MRRFFAFLLVSISCLFAISQEKPTTREFLPGATPNLTATGVSPSDVVISIQGFCDRDLLVEGSINRLEEKADGNGNPNQSLDTRRPANASPENEKTADCKTEVTREQFERLINAMEPRMSRSDRIRVAVRYAEGLTLGQKAKELGIDKDPKFQETAQYNYLQSLSLAMQKYLVGQAESITQPEVEKYYQSHPELFIEAHFLRIFVPNTRLKAEVPTTPQGVEQMKTADEAAMKGLAEKLRARAVAGASFERLQAEASKAAGTAEDEIPDVDLGDVNRAEAPPELQQVFDLKPGQISEVLPAPKGWHIVKMVSAQKIPLASAKSLLERIRIQEFTTAAKNSTKTEFNDAYFNIPHGMEPRQTQPK